MNEHPTANTPSDDERTEQLHSNVEPPHADPSTLRPAYAFDGSGPWLYGPDGSGPYAYTSDGRGPYRMGTSAFGPAAAQHAGGSVDGTQYAGSQYGNARYGNSPYAAIGGSGNGEYSSRYGVPYGSAATAGAGTPGAPGSKRRRIGLAIGAGVAALAIVGAAGGTALGYATSGGSQTTSSQSGTSTLPNGGSGSTDGGTSGGYGSYGTLPGQGGSSDGSSGSSSQSSATAATDSQKAGVVTIVSTLDYGTGEAAGTGMILSSDGEILTNNHVIEGATSIEVTDESTGKTYTASVVGTDATHDVAVLKLKGASGLDAISLDTDDDLAVGDSITDVGNANGTGNLVAAEGTVSALDQDITVQSESGTGTESLTGLIEVSADVVSGDSGGPVLDSDGEVVGMATAASSGTADVTGYAIPISTAKSIAEQILAGKATDTITIGLPAFLGVQVSSTSTTTGTGVTIAGTVDGSPAAKAGLTEGDVITSIDGTAITSSDQLTQVIQEHGVGDSVTVGYTDANGTAQTVTATLVGGPAD